MDNNIYEKLMSKIDNKIETLTSFSPKVPGPAENPHSTGLILNKDTDIALLPDNRVPLVHSMLHMFYQNRNGKGLSVKTIESLHSEVKKRLKKHKKFDRLDKNG